MFGKQCEICRSNQPEPGRAPLHPWCFPTEAWSRLHIDHAGPVDGWYYLVVVDAYSKWPEVYRTKSITSATTIEFLRAIFARMGLPKLVVSDNGKQFVLKEFESFLRSNGIKHVTTAPHHPATNGLAERFVQTLKRHLDKSGHLAVNLYKFLFRYRNTPHATTETAPSQLIYGRRLRSRLDLLRPSLRQSRIQTGEDVVGFQ